MSVAVSLFTRDLRVRDNPVLAAATRDADAIVPLFVFDDHIVRRATAAPNRLAFLVDSLHDLDRSLRERGGRLVVRDGRWVDEVLGVATAVGAARIHVARDVSSYAQRRLDRLERAAGEAGIELAIHESVTVVPAGELTPARGDAFLVFTPYHRRWLSHPWRTTHSAPRDIHVPATLDAGALPELSTLTDEAPAPDLARGGEGAGTGLLRSWAAKWLGCYEENHDDLAGDHTSRISPYLHFGCVSPLEVATRWRARDGGSTFVRQLCWRDFYAQLLAARPETAHEDVRSTNPKWSTDRTAIDAWRAGRTGYPVVDAGMRQLRREGWMHNRARMVVASFLTKDLMVDWRIGAQHFMHHLVDGDVAQNQLNWQWVAGTGTDTNPHRVYNPTVQGRKFDPEGVYIRRYVEELDALDDVHDPPESARRAVGYPSAIVDHGAAIDAWRASRR